MSSGAPPPRGQVDDIGPSCRHDDGAARGNNVKTGSILVAVALSLATAAPSGVMAAGLLERDERISAEEWRSMTEGRVVWYSLDGDHWGREFFHPGRKKATFLYRDGTCVEAPWIEADGVFCFAYGGMHCFHHVRRDGGLYAVPLGGGRTQTIERITDDGPLSCDPPPMM
jgi:hypothetical protein